MSGPKSESADRAGSRRGAAKKSTGNLRNPSYRVPQVGRLFWRGRFPYAVSAIELAYSELSGRTYTRLTLRGVCADCGWPFVLQIPLSWFHKRRQRRRCDDCKQTHKGPTQQKLGRRPFPLAAELVPAPLALDILS